MKGTLDTIIIMGCIVFAMAITPVWMGWAGVFLISFPLYMVYVTWPIRHKLAANFRRDWQQMVNLLRNQNEQQELLATGNEKAGGSSGCESGEAVEEGGN